MPAQRKTQPASLVEHLAEQAPRKAVNSLLGVSKYYVSADLLLRQADCYRKEANEEQQYVMLMRFASLLLETIPSHKDYNRLDPKYVQLKKVLVDRCFPELERLKLALRAKDVVDPQAHSRNRPQEAVQTAYSNLPGVNWGSQVQPSAPPMPAMQDLRVDDLLDIIQHGPGSSAPPPPPPPPSYGQQGYGSPAPALPVVPVYQPKYASSGGDRRHTLFFSPGGSSTTSPPQQQQYGDPLAPPYRTSSQGALAPQLPRYPGLEAYQQLAVQQTLPPTAGPSLGPQEVAVISVPADMQGRPDTCTAPHPSYGQQQEPREAPPPPPSAPSASSGGVRELVKRAALRDVHVSVALMEEFLAYARSNTSRGIESCGILAGRLSANDSIFTICTLIIPKQQGTTDTVQALNEEEIFEVQFSQELYPMGWIHTHPTQTCFLSSVDVHTHAGYQTMLDEAVAIVMAPTDRSKKCGIFRLSTPGGLQLVQRCNLRGFHAHPETATGQELYELCGHVFLNPRAKHTVVDLR